MTEIKTWKARVSVYDGNAFIRQAMQWEIDELRAALAQPEQPEQKPVLQDIEQYRLQMAGISTAAIGYWKEGDVIHPDYNTLALRDVAKLYAKYDELYKAQPVQERMFKVGVAKRKWESLQADGYEMQHIAFVKGVSTGIIDAWGKVVWQPTPPLPVQPEQQSTERNFCPRCGKRRGGDVNYIHTCTPPTPKAQNDVA